MVVFVVVVGYVQFVLRGVLVVSYVVKSRFVPVCISVLILGINGPVLLGHLVGATLGVR